MRNRSGFTLIELLVVVAIISLLISVLLPSLTKARETARRAVCASNLHQILIAAGLYSHDFQGVYPHGIRDGGGEHAPWLHSNTYHYFTQTLNLNRTMLSCPNKQDWFVDAFNGRPAGSTYGYRLGYLYLFGHPNTPWRPNDLNPWHSPIRASDPGTWVMAADVIEIGTASLSGGSSAPHGPQGAVFSPRGVPLEPEQLMSEGGNVAYHDGSVRWKNQAEMLPRYTTRGTGFIGYW